MVQNRGARPGVLLIGGGESSSLALGEALRRAGMESSIVPTVLGGVAAFAREPFDVVILSLSRFVETDLEAVSALRGTRPDVYLLVTFPIDRRDLAARALAEGADASLLEPYYLEEVLAMVRRALAHAPARLAEARTPPPPLPGGEQRLAGALAHAVNNPLQILTLLCSDKTPPAAADVLHEVARLQQVADELLDYADARGGPVTPFALNGAVQDAVPSCSDPANGIVTHRLADDLPPVAACREEIVKALRSLSEVRRLRGAPLPLEIRTGLERILSGKQAFVGARFVLPGNALTPTERDELARPDGGPLGGLLGLRHFTAVRSIERCGGSVERPPAGGELALVVRLPAAGLPEG